MAMELVKLDRDNFEEVINLRLDDSQLGLVSDNLYSIAQSAVNPDYQPRVAIVDGVVVGFVMYSEWLNADWAVIEKPNEFYIFRVMTDKRFQGKGYGRLLMNKVIDEIKQKRPTSIHIGYAENNHIAQRLYKSLGFVEYGKFEWGDIAARIEC